jgi:hypothetical protein
LSSNEALLTHGKLKKGSPIDVFSAGKLNGGPNLNTIARTKDLVARELGEALRNGDRQRLISRFWLSCSRPRRHKLSPAAKASAEWAVQNEQIIVAFSTVEA